MSKDIWHTQKETPEEDRLIVVENYSGFISVGSEFEYDLDRVRKWAYFDDLLALETELERTRKALVVATERLEQITHESFQGDQQSINLGFHIRAAAALTDIGQITALKQKDK